MRFNDITGAAKGAAILAILSFVVSFHTLQTSSINGVRTCSFTDYGALLFGALAAILGIVGLTRPGPEETAGLNRAVAGVALLVGLYRAGYGLGLVGGPC